MESRLSVKQLQLAGVGIIRDDLIRKTIAGDIYRATLYYKDYTVAVNILYKRNGQGFILGVTAKTEEDLKKAEEMMKSLIPVLPTHDFRAIWIIRMAIIVAAIITYLNLSTPIINMAGLLINIIDILGMIALIALYRVERGIYVKVRK